MAQQFATGKRSIAFCDRCGRQCLYRELRKLTINLHVTNIKVCPDCWEPDQPQYQVAKIKVTDPQGIMEPRPDPLNDEGTFVTLYVNYPNIPGPYAPSPTMVQGYATITYA